MKRKNVRAENLVRLIKQIFEFRPDGTRCFGNRVWLPRFGGLRDLVMHESHKSKHSIQPGSGQEGHLRGAHIHYCPVFLEGHCEGTYSITACVLGGDTIEGTPRVVLGGDTRVGSIRSPVCWSEVGDNQLTGPELIRDKTEKIIHIKNRLLTTRIVAKKSTQIGELSHWNLKPKCLAEGNIVVPMDEIQLDDKLHVIKEPTEVVDKEVK
ncbi:hypothetical protein Tco_0695680 [Tanacetum coccineum]